MPKWISNKCPFCKTWNHAVLSRWGIILIAKKNMCKVDVGRSLQNKFHLKKLKVETFFGVTCPHWPCTCFFWPLKWFSSGSRRHDFRFCKRGLITYLLGHSFSGNLFYINLLNTHPPPMTILIGCPAEFKAADWSEVPKLKIFWSESA